MWEKKNFVDESQKVCLKINEPWNQNQILSRKKIHKMLRIKSFIGCPVAILIFWFLHCKCK